MTQHGLVPRHAEIQYAQPHETQAHIILDKHPLIIRATMLHFFHHEPDLFLPNRLFIEMYYAGNSTHYLAIISL